MTDFGASFRKAREASAISLEKIAVETRISTRFLKAIEEEEFHVLPGGIFNRGFVRTFAERVGLDPEQAVADYERLTASHDPGEQLSADVVESRKKGGRLYAVAVGALILLIVVFYAVTRESGNTAPTASQPPAVVAEKPAAAPPPALEPPPVVAETLPDTAPAARTPAPPPAPSAALPSAPAAPPATPAPATKAPIVAEMEVQATTWIRVTTDGNNVSAQEILEPGMSRRFTAQRSMNLTIGNAAGVALRLNGKSMKSLGNSGLVREFLITPGNVNSIVEKGK